ncbi:hypothetical protein BY458DRAFT_126742 [Sporodiniella umbellata]|nr:hypothetical protein BY458DRAFT_126742 [Sporodiniella umbellata]
MNTSYNGKLQSVFLVKIMYNDNNHFCMGDTISPHLSVSNLYFKLDFRIVVKDFDNNEFDITTGELTRHSLTTSSKMYRDFLKSALTTKVHLNTILKRMPYIPENKIQNVVIPMVQIMGLSCVVYGMNIIDKRVYTLQKLCSFNYPSTLRELKKGGINAMINGFCLIESMIKNIEEMVIECSKTPSIAMSNIRKGKKKNTMIKTTDIDDYISTAMACPDSENENKSEDEDLDDEDQDEDPDDESQDDQEDEE